MRYQRIELDLSIPRNDEPLEFDFSGTSFFILKHDFDFGFRINSLEADQLYADEIQGFEREGVYRRLYITNESGTGKAVVLVFG